MLSARKVIRCEYDDDTRANSSYANLRANREKLIPSASIVVNEF